MSDYLVDINEELCEVSGAGDCARLRELLDAGADPNAGGNKSRYSALDSAAKHGQNETLKILLEAGAVWLMAVYSI